jgi:hypothetical protein
MGWAKSLAESYFALEKEIANRAAGTTNDEQGDGNGKKKNHATGIALEP